MTNHQSTVSDVASNTAVGSSISASLVAPSFTSSSSSSLSNTIIISAKSIKATTPPLRIDTELHAAVSYGYVSDDHVSKLLQNGADPNARDQIGGRTALHIAAGGAYFAGMEMLLNAGGDPNAKDDEGNIPLHHACMGGCGKYAIDVVMYLHQTGASQIGTPNHVGDTPLHLASAIGDTACVDYLLQLGANPEGPANVRGETPAHLAAGLGHMRVIELVTDYGANIDALDGEKRTPYDVAVAANKIWCAERIVELPRTVQPTVVLQQQKTIVPQR